MDDPYSAAPDCIRSTLASLRHSSKADYKHHFEDLVKDLAAADQSDRSAQKEANQVARWILENDVISVGDKEQRLVIALMLCHVLRLEAGCMADGGSQAVDDFLQEHEMMAVYKHLVWSIQVTRPGATFDISKQILQLAAEYNLFIVILDLEAGRALIKDLLQACIKAVMGHSDEELVWCCSAIMSKLFSEGHEASNAAVDLMIQQLSSSPFALPLKPSVRLLHNIVKQAEDALSMPLHSHICGLLVTQAETQGKKSMSWSSLQTCIRHLTHAVPGVITAIVPTLEATVATGGDAEAAGAADVLALILTSFNLLPSSDAAAAVKQLLQGAVGTKQALRLKVTHTLASVAVCDHLGAHQSACLEALRMRLLDAVATVRAAAVQALQHWVLAERGGPRAPDGAASEAAKGETGRILKALADRMKDSIAEVRESAANAFMPVFSVFVSMWSKDGDAAKELLAPALPWEQEAVTCLGDVLHALALPVNRRLFACLPLHAPSGLLLPLTGQPAVDTRLMVLLLAHATHGKLIRTLLDWHNGLKAQLAQLVELRTAAVQGNKSDRARTADDMLDGINALIQHFCIVMPKGTLSAGALKTLLDHPDNKLFESLYTCCCCPQAPRTASALGRKRTGALAGGSSGGHDADATAYISTQAELLRDIQERMRSRSKDVLGLLRIASLGFVTPVHVRALLHGMATVGDVDEGEMDGEEEAARTALQRTVKVVKSSCLMLLKPMGQELLYFIQSGNTTQRVAALELAAAAAKHMEPLALMGADREQAFKTLLSFTLNGPGRSAAHAVAAMRAFFRPDLLGGLLERCAAGVLDAFAQPGVEHEATGVNLAHAVSQLLRMAPRLVADHAKELVDCTMERMMSTAAPILASQQPGSQTVKKQTEQYAAWQHAPRELHQKRALITAVAKGLVHALAGTSGPDAALVRAALSDHVAHLLHIVDVDEQGAVSADEAQHTGLLRVAASHALLAIDTRSPGSVHPGAYVLMALVLQDPVAEVRSSFSCDLRKVVSKGLAQLSSGRKVSAATIGRHLAMYCFAAPDPCQEHAAAVCRDLVGSLQAWQQFQLSASSATPGEASSGAAATEVTNLPEYSLFFVLYLLARHDDFPTLEELADEGCNQTDNPLIPFQQMLLFHLEAAVRTSPDVVRSVHMLTTFCRIVQHMCEDATGSVPRAALQLISQLALQALNHIVPEVTRQEAARLKPPRGCTIPSKLFQRVTDKHGASKVAVPEWCAPADLPDSIKNVLAAAEPPQPRGQHARRQKQRGRSGGHPPTANPIRKSKHSPIVHQGEQCLNAMLGDAGLSRPADMGSPAPARKRRRTPRAPSPSVQIDDSTSEDTAGSVGQRLDANSPTASACGGCRAASAVHVSGGRTAAHAGDRPPEDESAGGKRGRTTDDDSIDGSDGLSTPAAHGGMGTDARYLENSAAVANRSEM